MKKKKLSNVRYVPATQSSKEYLEFPKEWFIGKLVKIVFPPGERMWIKVNSIGTNKDLSGILANIPILADVKIGDIIEFGLDEILEVYNGVLN